MTGDSGTGEKEKKKKKKSKDARSVVASITAATAVLFFFCPVAFHFPGYSQEGSRPLTNG